MFHVFKHSYSAGKLNDMQHRRASRGLVWLRETTDYTSKGMSREYFCPRVEGAPPSSICIPLFLAEFGSVEYAVPKGGEVGDLELVYQLEASHFTVRSSVPGKNSEPLGSLRVSSVQAVDLSLTNESPGLLEGLMTKLVMETSSDVVFVPSVAAADSKECEWRSETSIGCRRVTLIASIHECGHLRDMLLFLNSDMLVDEISQQSGDQDQSNDGGDHDRKGLKFGLPHWALYIPWWLYSGRVRKAIQLCLLLYTIFSVVWASWQLYRHFNIIHEALQPIVAVLKVYLSTVMSLVSVFLEFFTDLWTTFLSPLNILFGRIMITPLMKRLVRLFSRLVLVFGKLRVLVLQSWLFQYAYPSLMRKAFLLVKTFLYLLKPLFWFMRKISLLLRLIKRLSLVRAIERLVLVLMKPLSLIATRASYPPEAILKKMGMNEFKNNFLAICHGAIKLFQTHKTIKKATPAKCQLSPALNTSQDIRQRSIPVVYGSPVH